MKNSIFKNIDFSYILVLILTILGTVFFVEHIQFPMYDVGRELYYPELILQNKVLYKDIFNIFGPFSYLFNALIYKLFGSDLTTVYVLGYIIGITIISVIYQFTKYILDKQTAFIISLFSILTGITTNGNFNFTIPYSYAIVYGLISFFLSLHFYALAYNNNFKKSYLYLSVLFAGVAVCNKYEFILYSIFLLVTIFIKTNKNIKTLCMLLLTFIIPSLVCFGFLFYQGLTFSEFINSINLMKNLAMTKSYKIFYTNIGTYFSVANLKIDIANFCIAFSAFALFAKSITFFKTRKFLSIALFIIATDIILINSQYPQSLCFMPILVLLCTCTCIKKLNHIEKFIIISAIIESIKVFWYCNIKYYGVFFIGILLIALFILIKRHKIYMKATKIFLGTLLLLILSGQASSWQQTQYAINIKNNSIYSVIEDYEKITKLIDYINTNTKITDKIVIYPEGNIINYFTKRPTENIFYALQPPYIQLFSEEEIIYYYIKNKPEYFVIIDDNSLAMYGYQTFCVNYAKEFCNFVKDNYTLEKTLKYLSIDGKAYNIYKRK